MRICKSPMLGGRAIVCTSCQNHHYVYNSCGHSHCPICQSIKREQWIDKLKNNLLNVPYVHMIFTLPHQLNGLARANKKIIYSLILKTSWAVVKNISKSNDNIGGLPGMVSVLHTFGSDMKYHIHTHNLVTFGALELENNTWKKPKRKDKIARYRQINSLYKKLFLQALKQQYQEGKITYYMNYQQVEEMVKNITWVVHNTKPTLDTNILEGYLARYINRIAISNSKVEYLKDQAYVKLIYNDYRNQNHGQAAPQKHKLLDPFVFINQFLQHVLPPYFQKTRRYGLHSSASKKKYKELMPQNLNRQADVVRTVIQIVSKLINNLPYSCQKCQSETFQIVIVKPNKNWIHQYINVPNSRSPPKSSYIPC